MRSISKLVTLGLSVLLVVPLLSLRQEDARTEQIKQQLICQTDSLSAAIQLLQTTKLDISQSQILKQRFRKVRLAYKRLEWATEYFAPLIARQVNGPPVPETELSGLVIQPKGLQVIEQFIFPHFAPDKKQELEDLLGQMAVNAIEFREYFRHADLQNWQIFDAAKLEVFRIETLGLNDFDDPLSKRCFTESATALQSLQEVTERYG